MNDDDSTVLSKNPLPIFEDDLQDRILADHRIIFLDIDGVLNDWERSWSEIPDYHPSILPRCVIALNRIIRATEAKLVLSSSWRGLITQGDMSLNGFQVMLRSHGVNAYLIGHTRNEGDEYRWQEIAAWLRKPMWGPHKIKVHRYAIIDDDPDAFGKRPGVRTAGGKGLTEADADRVIELLL